MHSCKVFFFCKLLSIFIDFGLLAFGQPNSLLKVDRQLEGVQIGYFLFVKGRSLTFKGRSPEKFSRASPPAAHYYYVPHFLVAGAATA